VLVLVRRSRELWADVSGAGLARPDLGDLNLAAAAELRLPERAVAARALIDRFAAAWAAGAPYARYADDSPSPYWRYRVLEAAGLAVF
jgi:predicted nicotinamide N-methyase